MLCQKTEKLGPTYKIIIAYFLTLISSYLCVEPNILFRVFFLTPSFIDFLNFFHTPRLFPSPCLLIYNFCTTIRKMRVESILCKTVFAKYLKMMNLL